jgi:hypothetical protein
MSGQMIEQQRQGGGGIGRHHSPQISEINLIHRQYMIERKEIFDRKLTRTQITYVHISQPLCDLLRAMIGRIPHMPIAGSSGIDTQLHAVTRCHLQQCGFRQWRATNIA